MFFRGNFNNFFSNFQSKLVIPEKLQGFLISDIFESYFNWIYPVLQPTILILEWII